MFAQAVLDVIDRAGLGTSQVDLIGSHGQTICHLPGAPVPSTLQIGEPAVIAQRTGIPTIGDFRVADVAAGGQGAPLIPYVDFLLFRDNEKSRAMQNIGGIGNVTVLPANGDVGDILAFDTGPGNMIIDGLVRRISGGRRTYDAGGRRAGRGEVMARVLDRWMREPFLRRRPPKSAGR